MVPMECRTSPTVDISVQGLPYQFGDMNYYDQQLMQSNSQGQEGMAVVLALTKFRFSLSYRSARTTDLALLELVAWREEARNANDSIASVPQAPNHHGDSNTPQLFAFRIIFFMFSGQPDLLLVLLQVKYCDHKGGLTQPVRYKDVCWASVAFVMIEVTSCLHFEIQVDPATGFSQCVLWRVITSPQIKAFAGECMVAKGDEALSQDRSDKLKLSHLRYLGPATNWWPPGTLRVGDEGLAPQRGCQ